MALSSYLVYCVAVTLLILTPGPTMLMCMTNAINHGPRRALTSVAGSVTAVLGVMLLSAMGLGALLAASESAFMAAKAVGAGYLIYLGIRTFRSEAVLRSAAQARAPRRSFYLQGLMVGASNPKSVLFFVAFLPQFLDPAAPMAPQFAILGATFVAIEFIVMVPGAFGVARLMPWLAASAPARWINRICGGLFALMGGLLLFTRRAA